MTFYVRLPSGNIAFKEIEKACFKRLEFLLQILECDGEQDALRAAFEKAMLAKDSEYVLEGSIKDTVSHFVTRLCCSQTSDLYNFLCRAEVALFAYRLSTMTESEFCSLLTTTRRHLLLRESASLVAAEGGPHAKLLSVLEQLPARDFAATAFGSEPKLEPPETSGREADATSGCRARLLHVPFQDALSLVAARAVTLRCGIAEVPCSMSFPLLVSFFDRMLSAGGTRACARSCAASARDDPRFVELLKKVRVWHRRRRGTLTHRQFDSGAIIRCDDIDHEARFFPPCMTSLHFTLRHRHRLKHHSRISYSLFLKSIGLGIDEAMKFWKDEYSKPCNYGGGQASAAHCTHSWCASGKRYAYGIRHLYGLEGSRRNYQGQSCSYLQEAISCGEEGGCPFQHFDRSSLVSIMGRALLSPAQCAAVCTALDDGGDCRQACASFCHSRSLNNRGELSSKAEADCYASTSATLPQPANIVGKPADATSMNDIYVNHKAGASKVTLIFDLDTDVKGSIPNALLVPVQPIVNSTSPAAATHSTTSTTAQRISAVSQCSDSSGKHRDTGAATQACGHPTASHQLNAASDPPPLYAQCRSPTDFYQLLKHHSRP